MAKHFSNLSALRVNRDGKVTRENFKAHIAELQQALRDIQEELRVVTGGGKGQVPLAKQKKSFRLSAPDTSEATDKLEVPSSLRTTTQSRTAHDLVTKKEMESRVSSAASATGFMDLTTSQIIASGNKDFGSISFQRSTYSLDNITYEGIDLSGATAWELLPTSVGVGPTIRSFLAPYSPNKNVFRVVLWFSTTATQNLSLVHMSTAGSVTAADRIDTLSATADATISTAGGTGAFILLYNTRLNRWQVIARTA